MNTDKDKPTKKITQKADIQSILNLKATHVIQTLEL